MLRVFLPNHLPAFASAYLFADGVLRGESPRGNLPDGINPFRIGAQDNFGGSAFDGYIDEFRVWRRAVWTENFIPPSYPAMGDAALAAAVPPLSVAESGSDLQLAWPARSGIEYGVECSPDLRTWKLLQEHVPAVGLSGSATVPIDPLAKGRQFFRIGTRFEGGGG